MTSGSRPTAQKDPKSSPWPYPVAGGNDAGIGLLLAHSVGLASRIATIPPHRIQRPRIRARGPRSTRILPLGFHTHSSQFCFRFPCPCLCIFPNPNPNHDEDRQHAEGHRPPQTPGWFHRRSRHHGLRGLLRFWRFHRGFVRQNHRHRRCHGLGFAQERGQEGFGIRKPIFSFHGHGSLHRMANRRRHGCQITFQRS